MVVVTGVLYGFLSVHGALFRIENPTFRFDAVLRRQSVRFGSDFGYYCKSYGAVQGCDMCYGAVRRGFENRQ